MNLWPDNATLNVVLNDVEKIKSVSPGKKNFFGVLTDMRAYAQDGVRRVD